MPENKVQGTPKVEVHTSPEQNLCLLSFTLDPQNAELPDASSIFEQCENLGYQRNILITSENLLNILKQSVAEGTSITELPLNKDVDSLAKVEITDDRLKATLHLRKSRGNGKKLSLQEIGAVIRNQKCKRLKIEKAKKDILDFYKGPAYELTGYVLAEGKAHETGEDGKFVWEIEFLPENALNKIKEQCTRNNSTFDALESAQDFTLSMVGKIALVDKGVKIARVEQAKRGESGIDAYGKVVEGIPGKEPSAFKLFENLQLLNDEIVSTESGILDIGEKDSVIFIRIRPHKNGEVRVNVSDDRMTASVTLVPHLGAGDPIELDAVKTELEKAEVAKGLSEEKLTEAVEKVRSGVMVSNFAVAEGKQPLHGSSEKIIVKTTIASGKQVTVRKNGRADFKTHDHITLVKKDQLLAEIQPPIENPVDGWDVMGKTLPATKNTGIDLEIGDQIRKEEGEDGITRIYAASDGELMYDERVITINQMHTIEGDVDLKTGHVKFPGSVIIKGSVQNGFKVISSGDIIVGESVQGALLSADGTIEIGQGIKGGGKAILRAKKEIRSLFAEQAFLLSVEDIRIKNSCMLCTVKCNNKVVLGSDKGNFVGGTLKAAQGAEVKNLGARSGIRTEVSFGQNYLLGDQIDLAEKEIEKLKQNIMQFDALMNQYEKQPGENKQLENVRREKLVALKQMEKRSKRLFILREKFEEHFPSELKIKGSVYPGVIIESHGRFHVVREEKKNIAFSFNSELGTIEEKTIQ